MSGFVAESLRDIRRLCDHARVNLEMSDDVMKSGLAVFELAAITNYLYFISINIALSLN